MKRAPESGGAITTMSPRATAVSPPVSVIACFPGGAAVMRALTRWLSFLGTGASERSATCRKRSACVLGGSVPLASRSPAGCRRRDKAVASSVAITLPSPKTSTRSSSASPLEKLVTKSS